MVFKSRYPDIECPTNLTVWEYAFEDPRYSPLFKFPAPKIAGFTNAADQERLDFFQVKELATHLCTALVNNYGLQEADTVSLFSNNTIWYPVAMYAVLRAGGRVNGASPAYTVGEMAHALKTAKTKYIMTVPSAIKVVLAAAKEVEIPTERVFMLEGELEGHATMKQLVKIGEAFGAHGQSPMYHIQPGMTNDVCGYLNFSSGTTGLPKAVMLSHKNVISQCLQLKATMSPGKKTFLACLPLFHISGLLRFLHWPIAGNDECVMLPKFTIEAFLEAIVKNQVTDLVLVPTIIIRLVNDPIVANYNLTCINRIASGAAPLGREIIQKLQKMMPWTGFRQSYGMTESCCCLTTHPPELLDYKYSDKSGMLLGSTLIKIVDTSTGKELGPNEPGEILAKGPQIAIGYLSNPEETAEIFGTDGFLRTGDIGQIDDQGFIKITDRIKEIIKVKGQQVGPADLEHLLMSHPDVKDCAVLGIPDNYSVERPKAFVVLEDTVKPSERVGKDLMKYVKERRVRYKWLKEIEFIEEIPRGPSSKILRRLLRDKGKRGDTGHTVRDFPEQANL